MIHRHNTSSGAEPFAVASLAAALRAQRCARGLRDPRAFALTYLPHHCTAPFSRMHEEMWGILESATRPGGRGARVALAAPRNHAKSTVVSLAYVLWSALTLNEKHIVLLSATGEQAATLLRNVRAEIETNQRLMEDFPEVCFAPGAGSATGQRRHKPWRDSQILLNNGVLIRALGAGQQLRGLRHRADRPTLIVADDVEELEATRSPEQRRNLREWFTRTVLPAGDERTNVFIVGTVLHYDSLLARLTGASGNERLAGWDGRIYRAVEEFAERTDLWSAWERIYRGAERYEDSEGAAAARRFFESQRDEMLSGARALWPQREPYEALMEMRLTSGRGVFDAEKQNEPLDPDVCLFRPETFRYWDDEFPDATTALEQLGTPYVHCAIDPSLGGRGGGEGEGCNDGESSGGGAGSAGDGDFSGIVVGVTRGSDQPIYVLHAELVRLAPNDLAARIASVCKAHRVRTLWVEVNGFQALFARTLRVAMRDAGVGVQFKEVRNTGNKKERIASVEPYISTGRLRFSRTQTALLEQLRRFPLADHDDGPDALEMLVRGVDRPRPRIITI